MGLSFSQFCIKSKLQSIRFIHNWDFYISSQTHWVKNILNENIKMIISVLLNVVLIFGCNFIANTEALTSGRVYRIRNVQTGQVNTNEKNFKYFCTSYFKKIVILILKSNLILWYYYTGFSQCRSFTSICCRSSYFPSLVK